MTKVTFLVLILLSVQLSAQDSTATDTSYWTSGSLSRITFSQVSLENWAAGGESSSSINGFFSIFGQELKNRHKWFNSLDVGYGLQKQGAQRMQKSDDKIDFITRYGYQLNEGKKKWYLSAFLNLRTQFAPGYEAENPDSLISKFMSPGYLTIGVGFEFAPNKHLSFGYKPITGKMTFVSAEIVGTMGAYGVEPGKTVRTELGSYFRMFYKKDIFKNVNMDTRLQLFTGYEKNTFGNIDVNWQNSIVMKVNKHLSTNIFSQILYDDDIDIDVDRNGDGTVDESGPRIQFKNVFGVGVVYHFGAKLPKD